MIKVNMILLLILSSTYINSEHLNFCEFEKIETIVHNWFKKINHLCRVHLGFKRTLLRMEKLLLERDSFYNDFEEYISCITQNGAKEICIISANYRFYKWLFIICKKYKHMKDHFNKEEIYTINEFKLGYLDQKLTWIESKEIYLKNISSCYRVNEDRIVCLKKNLDKLKNQILLVKNNFNELFDFADTITLEIESQRKKVKNKMPELEFKCCCWV